MIRFLKKLHTLWFLFSIFFIFILLFPILYPLSKNPVKYYRTLARIRRFISLWGAYSSGIFFKVNYETPIDWSQPYIICPNHTSILDIIVVAYICPQPVSFLGKVELLQNPVTRIFFKTIDVVVDRSSRSSAFKAFKKADTFVKEGKTLVIFPEGKIDDEYPPQLHEFKAGSFKLAIDNKVKILPVVIHDAWKILWDSGSVFGSKPGVVNIQILAPIDTQHNTAEQSTEIQTLVYNSMYEKWRYGSNTIQEKTAITEKQTTDKQRNTKQRVI